MDGEVLLQVVSTVMNSLQIIALAYIAAIMRSNGK